MLYQEAYTLLDVPVSITDANGNTEWINPAFAKLTGYELHELIGKNLGSVLRGPQTNPEDAVYMDSSMLHGQPFKQETLNYRKDGTLFWVEIHATPIFNEVQKVAQFFTIQIDITERKYAAMQSELRELEASFMFEALDAAVMLLDNQLNVLRFNSIAQKGMDQLSPNAVFTEGFAFGRFLLSAGFGKAVDNLITSQEQKRTVRDDLSFSCKGKPVHLDMRVQPIVSKDESCHWLLCEFRDVTEQREFDRTKTQYAEMIQKNLIKTAESIHLARDIQRAIVAGLRNLQALFGEAFFIDLPKDTVSGDFLWVQQAYGKVYLAVGDCTGHGVPSAMFGVWAYRTLDSALKKDGGQKPHAILGHLQAAYLEDFDATHSSLAGLEILVCEVDTFDRTICYAAAGGKGLLVSQHHAPVILSGTRYGIGAIWKNRPPVFESRTALYEPGDMLYLFSDGYCDQLGGNERKRIGTKRFFKLLESFATIPLEKQENILLKRFHDWKSSEGRQMDDVMVMGTRLY